MSKQRGSRWWRRLLRFESIRRRIVFHIRREHFGELDLRIPIGGGLYCAVQREENLMSFGEIFCEREYDGLLGAIPLPGRWVDIGAHAGYFSMFLASRLAAAGIEEWAALLIEPDPRLRETIEAGIAQRALGRRAALLSAAVGEGAGPVAFALRGGMVSSLDFKTPDAGDRIEVPIASAGEIMARLAPPYDLIKLDIEGAEYDFARHYGELCRVTRALVVEWHAASEADPRIVELRAALAHHGLAQSRPLRPLRRSTTAGSLAVNGLELFTRKESPGSA